MQRRVTAGANDRDTRDRHAVLVLEHASRDDGLTDDAAVQGTLHLDELNGVLPGRYGELGKVCGGYG